MSGTMDERSYGELRAASARLRSRLGILLLAVSLTLVVLLAFAGLRWTHAAVLTAPVLLAFWLMARSELDERKISAVPPPKTDVPVRIQRLLDVLPDPTVVVDQRGLVASFNREAALVFPALTLNHPLSFAIRSPDVLDAVEDVLAGKTSRSHVELVERVPVDRVFEVIVVAIEGSGEGTRERVAVVLHDLTQVRQIEAMRVDFVANASHELRTPLASLLGFIETLQGPARNDVVARERFLGIMADQARRMSRLIDDLLSLSRIELNAHQLPRSSVDIVAVVGHIVDTLSGLAKDRKVDLGIRRKDRNSIFVAGDRDELLRVFENLTENAIKYGQSGGRVDVEIALSEPGEDQRQDVIVSITDHGPGIAPEHVPRLTERFYRVDVAESREKGGTGLGLAIVKHIVNRHRGRLEIESRAGAGARFSVLLAVRPQQQ
jgi:two-component system, OmpR family, phosphate regulon sensor histidine kinase PhoR